MLSGFSFAFYFSDFPGILPLYSYRGAGTILFFHAEYVPVLAETDRLNFRTYFVRQQICE